MTAAPKEVCRAGGDELWQVGHFLAIQIDRWSAPEYGLESGLPTTARESLISDTAR